MDPLLLFKKKHYNIEIISLINLNKLKLNETDIYLFLEELRIIKLIKV